MGKLLIWLGTKISLLWNKILCTWNSMLVKATVKVNDCPNKLCQCKD